MKTITISTNDGPKEHEAYRHGKFAVNLPYSATFEPGDDGEHTYNITHIATGLCVMSCWGRATARKIARKLDATVEFDITPEDRDRKSEQWFVFVRAIRPIVKGGE